MSNSTSKNPIISTILKWFFSLIFFFSALGSLIDKAILSSVLFLLTSLLLLPLLTEFWRTKTPFLNNKLIKMSALFFLALSGAITNPEITKNNTQKPEIKKENEFTKEPESTKESIAKIKTPHYEILEEATIRVDGAVSYFVLIDKVNLSNKEFMNDVKMIVNKIVEEKGSKINIEILDNRDALKLLYESHYGTNTLGRILNNDELNQLKKHLIASFTGNLDEMLYFNQLDFFPSASKNKYSDSIEYNPK